MAKKKNKKGKGRNSTYGSGTPDPSGFESPPFLSFDPALSAEQRAIGRGLEDYEFDFKRQRKRDQRDFRQSKKDIRQSAQRGRQDIRTDKRRGLRDLRFERQDIQREARRGREDYGIRIGSLLREYGIKSNLQMQSANRAGVASGGTLAAAAQARATNFALEKQPLDLALRRQTEDVQTSLSRLSGERRDFMQDTRRAKNRLGQDIRRDRKLTRRSFRDTRKDARTGLQRARREAFFGKQDLTAQQIWQARQLKPGAFDQYGRRKNK